MISLDQLAEWLLIIGAVIFLASLGLLFYSLYLAIELRRQRRLLEARLSRARDLNGRPYKERL